ncbi:MAG: cysteine synthase B [Nitrospirae bacterium CG_4_10_14_0_8_um_filter_41_23]|nr:MAG: cysteine synthase B [Nitrospirae bacterium CG11_big_fil_rev_8_21_14_0_20_41_14]PIV44469.1 MAG: cysteine synthase B [Nitrospirae bacterium CG02_land_8_20_14_3_00_41_53]PIW87558.1 MAG: cysteine synthase B [Nitrospirae bacterium CG_4_8_14_3_um_filter_41_47]PIY87390.1 MAG: cysteine synthase B [Nitrospirae bacterium CG_4_10_14_0_8_um_filter_41_23]PJA80381.1 MAG: cysteine synthase B [Nitrospirae bacterium CG_4_9_14_3_um_filter_41_27]
MGILQCIGNTPLASIDSINPNPRVKLFAKLEGNNPGGSVKDRIALYMIESAERDGKLTRDKIILEATSGNTGIGLAMVASAKKYRVKLTMPACVSIERRRILEAFGAELILSPSEEGTDGAIRLAHNILSEEPEKYFMPNQFDNGANILAHYETTGKEIIEQTGGRITHFVAGMGTTGTLMGAGKRLKEFNKDIKIIGVEPVLGHRIQGLKNMSESIAPKIFNPQKLDERYIVNDEEAFDTTRMLVVKEGIFAGMSSGAAMHIALRKSSELKEGVIVVILPDRGDRYLSTSLFTSVCAKCPP